MKYLSKYYVNKNPCTVISYLILLLYDVYRTLKTKICLKQNSSILIPFIMSMEFIARVYFKNFSSFLSRRSKNYLENTPQTQLSSRPANSRTATPIFYPVGTHYTFVSSNILLWNCKIVHLISQYEDGRMYKYCEWEAIYRGIIFLH